MCCGEGTDITLEHTSFRREHARRAQQLSFDEEDMEPCLSTTSSPVHPQAEEEEETCQQQQQPTKFGS